MLKTLIIDDITLRLPVASDLHAFNYYARKPHIGPGAGWTPHDSLAKTKSILDMFILEKNVWAITKTKDDLMIGTIGLHNPVTNHVEGNGIDIGYVLDDTYWNQGLMTKICGRVIKYLFEETNIDYINISHYEDNLGSQKVILKNNFKQVDELLKLDHKNIFRVSKKYKLTKKEYQNL